MIDILKQYLEQHKELYGNTFPVDLDLSDIIQKNATPIQQSDQIKPQSPPKINTIEKPVTNQNPVKQTVQGHGSLEPLFKEASTCENCGLCKNRTQVVFGSGNPNAKLMIIGEGPGADEDKHGLPFVGKAGQLLTKILEAIHFSREDVYITNLVKCRPPNNRDPLQEEMDACFSYLEKQIELVQPQFILALGRISGQRLLGSNLSLSKMRGQFFSYKNSELMVTYHPAALLRNPEWKRPTWEDIQKLRKRYDMIVKT